MTLIEYILNNLDAAAYVAEQKGKPFEITEQDLFENESEAGFARAWDADLFAEKILHKDLKKASFREVYGAFKAVARHIELENVSLEALRQEEVDEKNSLYQHYHNGVKKRNLIYNENYEQSSEDDFD